MSPANHSSWFLRPRTVPHPHFRLFLFHHAGGTASAYYRWIRRFPADWDVLAVELPGRGAHTQRPALASLQSIVDELSREIAPLTHVPFGLFGHSFGAMVASELQRSLTRNGREGARWLGLSAKSGPRFDDRRVPDVHAQPDEVLARYMLSLGGTPAELLEDPELRAFFLPPFRADMRIVETHRHASRPALTTPMSLFAGREDPRVPVEGVRAWRFETTGPVTEHVLPGGHFYLHDRSDEVIDAIVGDVRALPARHLAPNFSPLSA